MDQFSKLFAIGDEASCEEWDDIPSQVQEAPNTESTANNPAYNAFLLDEPQDQFVDLQSQFENKAPADGYDDLMAIDFTEREYQGDADLYALPSNSLAVDIQTPPLPQQAQHNVPLQINQFSPLVAIPGSQRQSPRYTLPQAYRPETPSLQVAIKYRNHILNLFKDPATALSIIDNFAYPFGAALQGALEQELQRQQSLDSFQSGYLAATRDIARRVEEEQLMSREFQNFPAPLPFANSAYAPIQDPALNFLNLPQPIPSGVPTSGPASQPFQPAPVATYQQYEQAPRPQMAPLSLDLDAFQDDDFEEVEEIENKVEVKPDGKKYGNKRPLNIKNFDAAKFYKPLATRPEPWGSINPETNEPLFKYTAFGELDPLSTFTPAQISEFIGQHPLNRENNAGLRLLIQTVPADSGRRYPNRASEKCRFEGCPDALRTIRKGDFRVAFDEQSSTGTDPFHNAGYVHLFCLEKFLDFPQLCKDFNVQPDVRVLPEGKNKMAITRDHPSMEGIVTSFIAESKPWSQFGEGIRPKKYYNHTLNYMLTEEHLKKQPKHLQRIRAARGGVSIDLHMNNLDLYVKMRRAHRKKSTREISDKDNKRKRPVSSDDESAQSSSDDSTSQRSTGQRPTKRLKR